MGLGSLFNSASGDNSITLPAEEQLCSWSFRSSLGKSLKKVSLTPDVVDIVKLDATVYQNSLLTHLVDANIMYRIKTADSIDRKIERKGEYGFSAVFNDLLGIRMIVSEYPKDYPGYYRVVDMRNGKRIDDGYRGVHLYYQRDNYSYIIEVQLWSDRDRVFNDWSHANGYKVLSPEVLLQVRKQYDAGLAYGADDFERLVSSGVEYK